MIRLDVRCASRRSARCLQLRRQAHHDALHSYLQQPVQQYISTSSDPYLNLSIEHHLLQKSPPDSVVLFLYVNRPSVIIGRNQNPWFEVNLPALAASTNGVGVIDLVRRRSGGGAVFHDAGNVNWSIISPQAQFHRDKHSEMIVRALRQLGINRARVNERHDVVLDQGQQQVELTLDDTHCTVYREGGRVRSLKVSGSAYKLTRHRALHHGTCLLSSPNITKIGRILRSPLKPFISARGVESVSSPVDNIGLSTDIFIDAVRAHFTSLYSGPDKLIELGEDCAEIEDIAAGISEIKSPQWIFLQTPQFTLDVSPDGFGDVLQLTVRYGVVTEAKLRLGTGQEWIHNNILTGQFFHEIDDWSKMLQHSTWSKPEPTLDMPGLGKAIRWFEQMVPRLAKP